MLVLGLETSTPQSSVCLATEDGLVASATLNPRPSVHRGPRTRAHGEFLAPAIHFCLRQAERDMSAISGVAVGLGPGLFTGMRVGIATAQTLAHARRLPVVGLASLDLLAYRVRHVRRLLCPALDARRGELFWAFYRSAPGGVQRVTEFRVGPAAKLAGEIKAVGEDVLCVGDGAIANRAVLESDGAEVGGHDSAYPAAEALAELAVARFLREEGGRPEELLPIYLRKADARIGWETRGLLDGGRGKLPPRPSAPRKAGTGWGADEGGRR